MNARIRWLLTEWPTSTTMLEIPIYLLVVGAMGWTVPPPDNRQRRP
jgi:hypothetical protein